jgi:NAD(P)-dependent dehydrogenase (short-subunit alcohol dehydrogenase family)
MDFTKIIHHDTYPAISAPTTALTGARVFISGASKGIGRSTAISYARAGASYIALGARSSLSTIEPDLLAAAKEAGHAAPKILLLNLDITSRSSITEAAETVSKEFDGKLDILINNAAVLEKWAPITESNEDEYWNTWEVNYRGIYWMTKSFLPLLLEEKGGEGMKTIVNLTSAGALNLTAGASAYQTTKMAVLKFTEFVMVEYGMKGILAFAVHPGGVRTDMGLNMPDFMHARRFLLSTNPSAKYTISSGSLSSVELLNLVNGQANSLL